MDLYKAKEGVHNGTPSFALVNSPRYSWTVSLLGEILLSVTDF